MRRASSTLFATPPAMASAHPSAFVTDAMERQRDRIRVLEEAFAHEQQRREELEKKYSRLKRRYVRLERAHAALQERRTLSTGEERFAASPAPSASPDAAVIDLTSPAGSRRTSMASPQLGTPSVASSEQTLVSEDYCAESPGTPVEGGRAPVQPLSAVYRRVLRSADRTESERGVRFAPSTVSEAAPAPAPRVGGTRRRLLDLSPESPVDSQFRSNHTLNLDSSERPRRSARVDVRHEDTSPQMRNLRPRLTTPAAVGSPVPSVAASSPVGRSRADSDEAASLALAQYLQHQENLAAIAEYREQLQTAIHEYESDADNQLHHHEGGRDYGRAGAFSHDAAIDPDNMSYEELLQLGDRVGDVKKERWRAIAPQILSSLPTHRWSSRNNNDLSCIVCQYNFAVGDVALTLPCAHVFHDECVTGWVRENNSCPLCKLEIADV